MKRLLLYALFLGLHSLGISQTSNTKIGDLITNPDGSKGIVFWINSERSKGYMLNLLEYPSYTAFGTSYITPETPELLRNEIFFDMNGFANTQYLKNQVDCNFTNNIACMPYVDIDNGWFIPSAGIWNLFYNAYPFIRERMVNDYGADPLFYVYWSSTQASASDVWGLDFDLEGHFVSVPKYASIKLRTVREFSMPPKMAYDTTLSYRWHTGDTVLNFFAKPSSDSLFSVTATSVEGCATTANKQIFVVSTGSTTTQLFDTVCAGYAYKQNGFDLPADSNLLAGTTTHTKTLSNGLCDVSITLHLTKTKTDSTAITDSFCEGKSYVHNGVIYESAGDYVQFLTCENQCDSILHLKLSCKYPKFSDFADTACGHYVWNNQYYYHSGIYSQTFVATNGCDSIVRKSITICNATQQYLYLDSCDRITYNGVSFFNDTTITDTLVNSNGCDSLLITKLTLLKSGFDTVKPNPTGCDSVYYRGQYYHSSTVVDTLIKVATCSTLETAFLTVNPSYFDSQNLHGTDSLEYLSKVYYRDTILTLSHQTTAGCDSIHKVNITIDKSPEPPVDSIESEIVVYWHRVLAVPNRKNLPELREATYYWYKDGVLLPQSNKDWIEVGQPSPFPPENTMFPSITPEKKFCI